VWATLLLRVLVCSAFRSRRARPSVRRPARASGRARPRRRGDAARAHRGPPGGARAGRRGRERGGGPGLPGGQAGVGGRARRDEVVRGRRPRGPRGCGCRARRAAPPRRGPRGAPAGCYSLAAWACHGISPACAWRCAAALGTSVARRARWPWRERGQDARCAAPQRDAESETRERVPAPWPGRYCAASAWYRLCSVHYLPGFLPSAWGEPSGCILSPCMR